MTLSHRQALWLCFIPVFVCAGICIISYLFKLVNTISVFSYFSSALYFLFLKGGAAR